MLSEFIFDGSQYVCHPSRTLISCICFIPLSLSSPIMHLVQWLYLFCLEAWKYNIRHFKGQHIWLISEDSPKRDGQKRRVYLFCTCIFAYLNFFTFLFLFVLILQDWPHMSPEDVLSHTHTHCIYLSHTHFISFSAIFPCGWNIYISQLSHSFNFFIFS